MKWTSEYINRLSLDGGNIILDDNRDTPIYIGNNKLIEIIEHNEHIYVSGEHNTLLRIRSNLLVEMLPITPSARMLL